MAASLCVSVFSVVNILGCFLPFRYSPPHERLSVETNSAVRFAGAGRRANGGFPWLGNARSIRRHLGRASGRARGLRRLRRLPHGPGVHLGAGRPSVRRARELQSDVRRVGQGHLCPCARGRRRDPGRCDYLLSCAGALSRRRERRDGRRGFRVVPEAIGGLCRGLGSRQRPLRDAGGARTQRPRARRRAVPGGARAAPLRHRRAAVGRRIGCRDAHGLYGRGRLRGRGFAGGHCGFLGSAAGQGRAARLGSLRARQPRHPAAGVGLFALRGRCRRVPHALRGELRLGGHAAERRFRRSRGAAAPQSGRIQGKADGRAPAGAGRAAPRLCRLVGRPEDRRAVQRDLRAELGRRHRRRLSGAGSLGSRASRRNRNPRQESRRRDRPRRRRGGSPARASWRTAR